MSPPLPVLFVQPWVHAGGPDTFVRHLAGTLGRDGFTFHVAVPSGRPSLAPLREHAAVHEIEGLAMIPRTHSPGALGRHAAGTWRAARALEGLARAHGVALVHTGTLHCWAGGIAARRLGVPHLYHVQGLGFAEHALAGRVVTAVASRTARAVVCVSEACRAAFGAHGGDPNVCRVLYNGIDLARFDPGRRGPRAGCDPVVAMVAMFDARKGHDLFVRMAQRVRRHHPRARFVIAGDAETAGQRRYLDFVLRLAAEAGLGARLAVRRDLRHAAIPDFLSGVNVAVVPSRTEALPYAAIEAAAMAVPVVAARVGGLCEIVEDGRTGLLVDPENPAALARAVVRLLDDPASWTAMGRRARSRAARLFDLHRSARSLGALYRELVPSAPTAGIGAPC